MPKIVITGSSLRQFTGGVSEFEVTATNFHRLIRELDERFPGLGHQVEEGMAIAIDGTITRTPTGAEIRPDSEVYLIPKIGGG